LVDVTLGISRIQTGLFIVNQCGFILMFYIVVVNAGGTDQFYLFVLVSVFGYFLIIFVLYRI